MWNRDRNTRGVCGTCGVPVHTVPARRRLPLDEWEWEDESGGRRVSSGLLEAIERAGGMAGVAARDIGLYSSLTARMSLGFAAMGHNHWARGETTGGPSPDEVPWCHGDPMYLGVESWVCRKTRKSECAG